MAKFIVRKKSSIGEGVKRDGGGGVRGCGEGGLGWGCGGRGCMMERNRGMREKSKVLINPRTFSKI